MPQTFRDLPMHLAEYQVLLPRRTSTPARESFWRMPAFGLSNLREWQLCSLHMQDEGDYDGFEEAARNRMSST
jgi:hypothetical protein